MMGDVPGREGSRNTVEKKKPCQPVLFHDNLHLLSVYYTPETILNAVNVLLHLIFTISLKGRQNNFSHLHEKTDFREITAEKAQRD